MAGVLSSDVIWLDNTASNDDDNKVDVTRTALPRSHDNTNVRNGDDNGNDIERSNVVVTDGADVQSAITATSTRASLLPPPPPPPPPVQQRERHDMLCGGKRARTSAHDAHAHARRGDSDDEEDVWVDKTPRASRGTRDSDGGSGRTTVAAPAIAHTPSAQKTRLHLTALHNSRTAYSDEASAPRSSVLLQEQEQRQRQQRSSLLLPLPATVSQMRRGGDVTVDGTRPTTTTLVTTATTTAPPSAHDVDAAQQQQQQRAVVRTLRSADPPTTTRPVELKPGYEPPSPRSPLWSNLSVHNDNVDDDDDDAAAAASTAQGVALLGVHDPLLSTTPRRRRHRDSVADDAALLATTTAMTSSLFASSPARQHTRHDVVCAATQQTCSPSVTHDDTQADQCGTSTLTATLDVDYTLDDSNDTAFSLTQEALRLAQASVPTVVLQRRQPHNAREEEGAAAAAAAAAEAHVHDKDNSAAAIAALLQRTTTIAHAGEPSLASSAARDDQTTGARADTAQRPAAVQPARAHSLWQQQQQQQEGRSQNNNSGTRRSAEQAWAHEMRRFFADIDQRPLLTVKATKATAVTAGGAQRALAHGAVRGEANTPQQAATRVDVARARSGGDANGGLAAMLARVKAEARRERERAHVTTSHPQPRASRASGAMAASPA